MEKYLMTYSCSSRRTAKSRLVVEILVLSACADFLLINWNVFEQSKNILMAVLAFLLIYYVEKETVRFVKPRDEIHSIVLGGIKQKLFRTNKFLFSVYTGIIPMLIGLFLCIGYFAIANAVYPWKKELWLQIDGVKLVIFCILLFVAGVIQSCSNYMNYQYSIHKNMRK